LYFDSAVWFVVAVAGGALGDGFGVHDLKWFELLPPASFAEVDLAGGAEPSGNVVCGTVLYAADVVTAAGPAFCVDAVRVVAPT
jgi:hypothetical protein